MAGDDEQNPLKNPAERESPAFWIAWHALSFAIVLTVPLHYRWGVSISDFRLDWLTQILALAATYLALAAVLALLRVRRTVRGIAGVIAIGIALYGIAYLLLILRGDVPVSRAAVAISAAMGIALAVLPLLLQRRRALGFVVQAALLVSASDLADRRGSDAVPLRVVFGARSLSKLPFLIALDQGLYEKYGLDIQLWMPPLEFPGGIEMAQEAGSETLRPQNPDILVDGHSPIIYRMVTEARFPRWIALAGGDCVVRTHIIGRKGLTRLEDLKGKRLGIHLERATTGFVARLLAQRMGWDPELDISILDDGRDADALRDGHVDAIVANERTYAVLAAEGYPVLANTTDWNEPIGGNSVLVRTGWLAQPGNDDLAMRFLKASAEGMALFHRRRDLALDVMARWHGIANPELGDVIYSRGESIPQKPFPCYDGIKRTMELYDSNEMRRYQATDFYDDSLVRQLDESGFLDELYR
jgi:ABC-type nitrate/sulfonate/bicarbonate transport system substrate-binding protein